MKNIKVTLKHPIEAHGETIKTLEMEDPDLGMLDDVEIVIKGDGSVRVNLGDLPKIVANLTGIPPSAAKKIKIKDMGEITMKVMDFFQEFLPTGGS